MRNYQPHTRRSNWSGRLLGGAVLTLLIGGGLLGTLLLLGVNLNPFAQPPGEDPFMVRIPINATAVPAYSRVDRSHLIHPATGGIAYQRVPPSAAIGMSIVGIDSSGTQIEGIVETVRNEGGEVIFVVNGTRQIPQSQTLQLGGAMMNVSAIIGRVVKRDKRAGMGFREDSFFPQGTPEGLAGATPAGMRTVTLDATKLSGVYALNAGDQIDLMANIPAGSDGGSLVSAGGSSSHGAHGDQSEPVLLAQNAVVLKPVYVRNEAATSASLTQGTRIQNVPKYEVAIAVHPDDVIPLQTALNRSLAITCITHSMKPLGSEPPVALVTESDMVSVPVTVRTIFAYDVVSRDAFVSPATRTLKSESMPRQQADRLEIITSLDDALGAIARHDIPAGRYLRRSDLLSGPPLTAPAAEHVDDDLVTGNSHSHGFVSTRQLSSSQVSSSQPPAESARATAVGDRPAITRFIPPGRTAFAIPWNRIYGAEHLQIGDQIDLLASYSLESDSHMEETETRPDGTTIVRRSESLAPRATERTWDESLGFRAEPWFVASDAVVIAPVGFPAPASALRALGEVAGAAADTAQPSLAGPPVIIAVEDRDVESFATALATQGALFTVAFHAPQQGAAAVPRGSKQIAILAQPIPPYQQFSETIWKGNRRRIASRIVSTNDPQFIDAIPLDGIDAYWGRVLARPKSRGDHLTADDFLPAGTAAGLAAGVQAGHTLFVVADHEIEGLDSFETEDRIAILRRGVVKPPADVSISGVDLQRPVSSVVVNDVRIARRSLAGQTVLEIANDDLSFLQATLADSLTADDSERTHLVAVVRPRQGASSSDITTRPDQSPAIPAYDPLANLQYTEVIIGRKREIKGYAGSQNAAASGVGR